MVLAPAGETSRLIGLLTRLRDRIQFAERCGYARLEGLRRLWLLASLLVGSQSAAAMLPSSRLATSQNRQQQTVFYPEVWSVSVRAARIPGEPSRRFAAHSGTRKPPGLCRMF